MRYDEIMEKLKEGKTIISQNGCKIRLKNGYLLTENGDVVDCLFDANWQVYEEL
jgi:hypothetical protein